MAHNLLNFFQSHSTKLMSSTFTLPLFTVSSHSLWIRFLLSKFRKHWFSLGLIILIFFIKILYFFFMYPRRFFKFLNLHVHSHFHIQKPDKSLPGPPVLAKVIRSPEARKWQTIIHIIQKIYNFKNNYWKKYNSKKCTSSHNFIKNIWNFQVQNIHNIKFKMDK